MTVLDSWLLRDHTMLSSHLVEAGPVRLEDSGPTADASLSPVGMDLTKH